MDKQADLENAPLSETLSSNKTSSLDKLLNEKTEHYTEESIDKYPYSLIGKIATFDHNGYPLVHFLIKNQHYTLKANTIVTLAEKQTGQQCLITFNQGNINDPIITGLLQPPLSREENKPTVIHSESGIILKCGSSRIELTENGTINIQGMHINSQAYGPHRIKGGSVKIN